MSGTTSSGNERSTSLVRTEQGRYRATNVRGGTLDLGSGETLAFIPGELLLATFEVVATGDKIRDDAGNRITGLHLDFRIEFADDEAGRAAEAVLARSVRQSHDRLCTVSRTVEVGTPVSVAVRGTELDLTGPP